MHEYTTTPDFALNLKQIASLAFVPPQKVSKCYDTLVDSAFFKIHDTLLQPLLGYVENTWIGGLDRRRNRRAPLFSIDLWNCYESVLNDLNKTNNHCEGFNNGFHSLLGAAHPSIFKFIDGLKKQQGITDLKREQLLAGSQQSVGRNTYKDCAAKLKNVVENYGTYIDTNAYLRAVAHNIELSV